MKSVFCGLLFGAVSVAFAEGPSEPAANVDPETIVAKEEPVAAGSAAAAKKSSASVPAPPASRVVISQGGALQLSSAVPITWNSETEMNRYFVFRFIHTAGLGSDRMPAPYMSANKLMRLALEGKPSAVSVSSNTTSDATKIADCYRIDSLELIGIAKHETPVAYEQKSAVSGRAGAAQSRALTDFEMKAIAELKDGNDVSLENASGGRTVVGSVRAGKACLGCHEGYKVGDLLGAFTYQLSRAEPVDLAQVSRNPRLRTSLRSNELAIERGTVMGHLEQTRIALQSAVASLEKSTAAEHGDELDKLNSALERALTQIAAAMSYVEQHPDVNIIGPGQRGEVVVQPTVVPQYVPRIASQFSPTKAYSGEIGTGVRAEKRTLALSAEDEHGIRIDQDGKGLSVPALRAIEFLDTARRQFTGPMMIRSSSDPGMEELRSGIANEISKAAKSALAVLDYVHDHVSGRPAEVVYPGPGVK